MSIETIEISGTEVELHRKGIKNLHIGVYPPGGRVRVAAPMSVSDDAVKVAVLTKLDWIRRRQVKFQAQQRQSERHYVTGETHFHFGRAFRLDVISTEKRRYSIAIVGANRMTFTAPQSADTERKRKWMQNWHRSQLRGFVKTRIGHWADLLKVEPETWGIRTMRTKWGSCNPDRKSIWLNAELAHKPRRAIDYVILHELAHLISPTHDTAFINLLDQHMPNWRLVRAELNALPLSAELA
jgi:hypothetical protein